MQNPLRHNLSRVLLNEKIDWKPLKSEGLFVIGVDEVGRGCLAGPVMSAAVILSHHEWDQGLTDSKKLSESRREDWAEKIKSTEKWSLGIASVEEIDELNILQASLLSMKRAVLGLGLIDGLVLVDGNQKIPGLEGFKQMTFVKGDLRLAPISAASIVAKVTRDHYMKEQAQRYPQFGFEVHKGYGTPLHREALKKWGTCAQHRRSFAGLAELPEFKNEVGLSI